MSVINQMLRDLEARKIKPAAASHYIDKVNIIAPKRLTLWWLLLPVLIVTILSVNIYLYLNNQQTANAILKNEQQQTLAPVESYATANLRHKPAPGQSSAKILVNESVMVQNETNHEAETAAVLETAKAIPEKPLAKVLEHSIADRSTRQPAAKIKTIIKTSTVNFAVEKPVAKTSEKIEQTVVKLPDKGTVKIKQIKPDSHDLIHQARVLMADDHLLAIQLLEDNLSKIKPGSDYYALLANLYQRQHRYDDAIIVYKKALKIMPDKGELWIGIALAYQGRGEAGNAQMAFKRALSSKNIHPDLKQFAAQRIE